MFLWIKGERKKMVRGIPLTKCIHSISQMRKQNYEAFTVGAKMATIKGEGH